MQLESREYHPERMPYELFLGNHPVREPIEYGYKTIGVGLSAYDVTPRHNPVKNLVPIFVSIQEFIETQGIETFYARHPDTAKTYNRYLAEMQP